MKKTLLYVCFVAALFLTGCAGLFATNDKLSDAYPLAASDGNMTVFYDPGPAVINMAVKNTGSAFMSNLSVAFTCVMPKKTDTRIYSLGNLKPYFNKKLTVPAVFADCVSFTAEYTFLPYADGGFINDGSIDNGFQRIPPNPVEGVIVFK